MQLNYERYLDQVLGGWIGKSIGGTIGTRFEGHKGWIEISPEEMFPDEVPPNDDLDLQVLWLKVLEEKGAALTSDDLAEAWLEGCWYPFNEYGIFRRNWRLGIHPPMSGKYNNQFWETGMGCPIRAEIWGYSFPGAPDLAAKYAWKDGVLDHTEQAVGAEMMFAAMASMAFFVPDVRRLTEMFIHYLPKNTPIERLTHAAFQAYDEGLSLRDAHDRLMALNGLPEACDSQINVPFTFLGLLYGGNDLQEVLLSALRCGYDTDCTMATAGALVGQILGASRIPEALKQPIGDELVMGIEYSRDEMTLSALARDNARMGVLLTTECQTGIEIVDAPKLVPLPATAKSPATSLYVEYEGLPAAAPGDVVEIQVHVQGEIPANSSLYLEGPEGWAIVPQSSPIDTIRRVARFSLHAPLKPETWSMQQKFNASLKNEAGSITDYSFGVAGAGLWQFLGMYYEPVPEEGNAVQQRRRFNHHFVSLQKDYLPEPVQNVDDLYNAWSKKLGKPALVPSYEHEIDLSNLIGLQGPYCAYLARTVISPKPQKVFILIGNTDSYRLYLNGELVGEVNESVYWTPFNNWHTVTLQEGENHLVVKLLKSSDTMQFTLGFRNDADSVTFDGRKSPNHEDWLVNLADVNPLAK